MRTQICDRFGIEHPIFAHSESPEVVAEVSRAGGFGVLGALGRGPAELDTCLGWLDEQCEGRPYGVSLAMPVAPEYLGVTNIREIVEQADALIPEEHRRFTEELLSHYGVPAAAGARPSGRFAGWTSETAEELIDVVLAHRVTLLSNALGPPPEPIATRAREHGLCVAAVARDAEEAWREVEAGTELIIAHGSEGGGPSGEVTSMVLIPEVVDAVQPNPVLAAGGIGNGRQAAAAIALGAEGVWTGTVWLTVCEAMTPPVLLDKLLRASSRDTVQCSCGDGRVARQLRTAWTAAWSSSACPGVLPVPLQHALASEAFERIREHQCPELIGTPVGQVIGQIGMVRFAADVVRDFVLEYEDAVSRIVSNRTPDPSISS